jgi:hypothetical protein
MNPVRAAERLLETLLDAHARLSRAMDDLVEGHQEIALATLDELANDVLSALEGEIRVD